jgi:hypothetical protein
MKSNHFEVGVWYSDRLGKTWRALNISGSMVRYEDQTGTVGDMEIKKFASKCVLKAEARTEADRRPIRN